MLHAADVSCIISTLPADAINHNMTTLHQLLHLSLKASLQRIQNFSTRYRIECVWVDKCILRNLSDSRHWHGQFPPSQLISKQWRKVVLPVLNLNDQPGHLAYQISTFKVKLKKQLNCSPTRSAVRGTWLRSKVSVHSEISGVMFIVIIDWCSY